ncbi:integral membrane protein [Diaporthe sp. PMI_573]|nr:integral membrane protein [Diaporthaceae sp. PMI_573]
MTSSTIPIELPGQVGFLATATFCMVLPTALVILRILARRKTSLSLNGSDFCIVAALTFDIGLCIVDYFMVLKGGFGFHIKDIERRFGPETLVTFNKCIAAWPILWSCCVVTSKWSVLLMYQTLIPVARMKMAVRVVGTFIILFALGGILEAFLICRPYAKNYYVNLEGTCGNVRTFYIWLSALNLFSDLVILLLPIPFLYKLQMPLRKRLGLISMFMVGVLTCVVTLYRQTTLGDMDLKDITASGLLAFLASTIEIAVAICIACLPFLRALWGSISSQRGGSSNNYDSCGSRGLTNGRRTLKSDGFGHLPDDSSEIRLQPLSPSSGRLV